MKETIAMSITTEHQEDPAGHTEKHKALNKTLAVEYEDFIQTEVCSCATDEPERIMNIKVIFPFHLASFCIVVSRLRPCLDL